MVFLKPKTVKVVSTLHTGDSTVLAKLCLQVFPPERLAKIIMNMGFISSQIRHPKSICGRKGFRFHGSGNQVNDGLIGREGPLGRLC